MTEKGRRDLSIMESSHAVIFQPSEYGYIQIKFFFNIALNLCENVTIKKHRAKTDEMCGKGNGFLLNVYCIEWEKVKS